MSDSEIIEFVLPTKEEYPDDVDAAEYGRYVVVLDSHSPGNDIHPGHDQMTEYHNEEFLIINEDGNDGELLVDEADLDPQLAMLRVPKSEIFSDDGNYVVTEQQLEDIEDLVEEEEENDDDDNESKYTITSTLAPAVGETASLATSMQSSVPSNMQLKPVNQLKSNTQHLIRTARTSAHVGMHNDDEMELQESENDEPIRLIKPSDKMLDEFKGPRRYLLFDDLIATIVDFDEERTPIVEFSMVNKTLDEKLPVECGICPDVMHKTKLSKHQKTHLVPGTNRYACIYCTETYRDCKYLAGHARRHMGIRPYVCEPCKLYFSTKQDLRVHNQRRHLEKEHICEMCGKTFAQYTQLKRHREATHEKKRRFQCQYCQKAYYKNFSLQEHIRNVHMGKRRMLSCPFCGMQCRDAHKMARHRKEMHLNQDAYVCHLCQEEFTDINYFDAHKRSIQCRSNTRRQITEGQQDQLNDEVNSVMPDECDDDENAVVLEEEYDEDMGLLVENDGPIVEGVDAGNGSYMHEQEPQDTEVNAYEQNTLLIVRDGEEGEEGETLLDEEQYIEAIQQHYQAQSQQYQQQVDQEFNDEDLIYEITLETEDN